jgi:tubulin polyglutamylase TTLL11
LNKKKFDFRIYVLIKSIDPFVVFIAKENMGRFCVEDYKKPSKKGKQNDYS